jgi:hypothetical protein
MARAMAQVKPDQYDNGYADALQFGIPSTL